MKIRHIENVRAILFYLTIATSILSKDNNLLFGELNELLLKNDISLEELNRFLSFGYDLSLMFGFDLEQLTKDYKEIKHYYNEVISNTSNLVKDFGFNDNPIKTFALFVYLYRGGYLSYPKKFLYSVDMKDLSMLCGVDVIRGTGVCRSISSMFTDVCNEVGLSAKNLSVKATNSSLNNSESLSTINLEVESQGKKFAKIVGKVTSILPIGNHLVTLIDCDDKTGLYDPTNDVFMQMNKYNKYGLINDYDGYMKYNVFSNLFPKIFGQVDTEINVFKLANLSKMSKISYEEYCYLYKLTLETIEQNLDFLEDFYQTNLPLYYDVNRLAMEQHGVVKRMIPIVPDKKRR